jgi:hypothetical protein
MIKNYAQIELQSAELNKITKIFIFVPSESSDETRLKV